MGGGADVSIVWSEASVVGRGDELALRVPLRIERPPEPPWWPAWCDAFEHRAHEGLAEVVTLNPAGAVYVHGVAPNTTAEALKARLDELVTAATEATWHLAGQSPKALEATEGARVDSDELRRYERLRDELRHLALL